MFIKTFLLVLLTFTLEAAEVLKSDYFITGDDINLSVLVPHAKEDTKLFSLETNRYSRKIKSKELLAILKNLGFSSYKAQSRYVNFIKKSPIDTTIIETTIRELYEQKYPAIEIKSIKVLPRGYLNSLPPNYSVTLSDKNYLHRSGTLFIKTSERKKIFFDYDIEALINVYAARSEIKRHTELSLANCTSKRVTLDKFSSLPVQNLQNNMFQSKHQLKEASILVERNVEHLSIVKQGAIVSVMLDETNLSLSFTAKALQDGKLDDTITIEKYDKKRLKAKVIGINRVEIK